MLACMTYLNVVLGVNEDVTRLQIAMNDTLRVDVVQTFYDLTEKSPDLVFVFDTLINYLEWTLNISCS